MPTTTFGPYRIEELLGRGGMGEVYRAHDTERDREVALKVLPTDLASDAEYKERFRRECRAAARLNEPHIVPIHTFGEIEGQLYLDMRLVRGTDLGAWLRTYGALPTDVAVSVVAQVAAALEAAHAAGLVHRDVKPSNILLAGVTDGTVDAHVFAYLFDFGIARARDGMSEDPALTRAGTTPGSLPYIAPERFDGVEGDPRADVYALACVLHESLTGRPPFEGNLATLVRAHMSAPPPRPSNTRPDLPPELDGVVARGMAKNPHHRTATAAALAVEARAAIAATNVVGRERWNADTFIARSPGGPIQPRPVPEAPNHNRSPGRPPGPPDDVRTTVRPRRIGPIVAGVIGALVLVGGAAAATAVLLNQGSQPSPPSDQSTPSTSGDPSDDTTPSTDAIDALLAILPASISPTNCSTIAEPGAVVSVICVPSSSPPSATAFSQYESQTAMDAAFNETAAAGGATTGYAHEQCATNANTRTVWTRVDGTTGGQVGCSTDADGVSYLFWSDNDLLTAGYISSSTGDAAGLHTWWLNNDFRRL